MSEQIGVLSLSLSSPLISYFCETRCLHGTLKQQIKTEVMVSNDNDDMLECVTQFLSQIVPHGKHWVYFLLSFFPDGEVSSVKC